MWKRRLVAGVIDKPPVYNVLKTAGMIIHIIHGINNTLYLSTFCQQDFNRHFHKVIHALIVHNEGVDRSRFKLSVYGQSIHLRYHQGVYQNPCPD